MFRVRSSLATKRPGIAVACLGVGVILAAAQDAPLPQTSPAKLRVTTRLVQLDVLVTDKQGRPVSGLTKDDFALYENGKPQTIATFSYTQPQTDAAAPPPLPPNHYTNRPEYQRPPGPLTMLMLDALNTPASDQANARRQLLRYLETQLQPGQGTAIFALGNSLRLLQDFTDDPRLLHAAIQEVAARKPRLTKEDHDRIDLSMLESHPQMRAAARQLYRLEEEQLRSEADTRVQITLGALRSIARSVGGYPGRKNLVWISSAFPLTLQPEQFTTGNLSLESGLANSPRYMKEVRQTAAMLAYAQVAIYPVDARGLVAGSNDPALGGRPEGYSDTQTELLESHGVMQQLAEETGGRAFFNRNDIDRAVALSAADGTSSYQLGFYPVVSAWDGKFHRLKVHVSRPDLEVRSRRGYFAEDPLLWRETLEKPDEEMRAALRNPIPATQVTFVARVLEQPADSRGHVDIQFAVYADSLSFEEEAGGLHHAQVDFVAVAFAPDGSVAAQDSRTSVMHLRPDIFSRLQKEGVPFQIQLELAPGSYQLSLGVRDSRTGAIGTTAVPLEIKSSPKPAR